MVEQEQDRYERLEEEFRHRAIHGDGTELFVLERAGIARPPDIVVAVTGDDEDNIVICQLAREKYGVTKVIARVNDPRNQPHFDLLGVSPTVSATSMVLALIEHEVPQHELVHLLELRKENLEIVEVEIEKRLRGRGQARRGPPPAADRPPHLGRAGRAGPRSPWARPSSARATRCSRSSSRAAKRISSPCSCPPSECRST